MASEILKSSHGVLRRPTRNEAITHCPKGHEYTPENTRFNKRKSRICRACDKDHHVRLNVRRKAARARASIGKGE